MPSATQTEPPGLIADSGDVHIERLNALWKLSVQPGLGDAERVVAMLDMAVCELDMDLVVLEDFSDNSVTCYAIDRLEAVPASSRWMEKTALSQGVHLTRESSHIADLRQHPTYADDALVKQLGVHTYSGLPVSVGDEAGWVLAFLRRRRETPPDDIDIAYMGMVADWLGTALHQLAQKARLERIASTDTLTDLPNRRAAEERLKHEKARVARDGQGFALVLLDIDHFKMVNDRYGHAVGDEVLRIMASRFQAGLREGDWAARWGGEEFLFVLHGSTTDDAVNIMNRLIHQSRTEPVQTSIGNIALSFSAGVVSCGTNDSDLAPLLEGIDQALYLAKANGRNQIRVATPADHTMPWSCGLLRQALVDNRIIEARDFVDMAEGLGLMAEVDRQVARDVMRACVSRMEAGGSPDFSHFVNVSPQFLARRDLVDELLNHAMNFCQSCNVALGPVKPIVLELTERQHIVSLEKLRADLQPFIEFGFRLALDDFGSGYSSYLYLANLPVGFLKIEGWLVQNMQKDRKVAGIVESLASFARKEGVLTVAEHVEDAETARILRDMGVDFGQGWYFGRPQLV
ncbi:MAG: hypothetical protein B7X81_10060 [Hydrogenophilales bacterium 17-61-76]|nr:MAG: hypothetical protein B7X81_10060 [Hydrogenophilales bacterium 17-61-76]